MEKESLDDFDERTKNLAFYLQDNIYRHGLPPVRFMDRGHSSMKKSAKSVFRKNLRKYL